MEEWPVLVVLELGIKFMVPYNAARANEVNELQDERVLRLVKGERQYTLQAAVRPLVALRIGKVDTGRRCSKYLVEGGWDCGCDL